MNELLMSTKPHLPKKITDEIKGKSGYINLAIGIPDYGPPKKILEYLKEFAEYGLSEECAHYNKYGDSRGVVELREAIASRHYNKYHHQINHEHEILITHGAAEAIWLTIFTCTNIGDEVIIPDPGYMLYEPIIVSLGRKAVLLKTSSSEKFHINLPLLEKAITHKTKLIIINSPSNPTGAVYSGDLLQSIGELALKNNIYVMHDEVFDDNVFNEKHIPIVTLSSNNTNFIMVNSFSKKYGITGWRLGWMLGPKEVIDQAIKAHTLVSIATNSLIQHVIAKVVNDPVIENIVKMNNDYMFKRSRRFSLLIRRIEGLKMSSEPAGSMYVFPEIKALYCYLPKEYQVASVSDSVAKYILDKAKVAVIPGSAFGIAGDNHIRISVACSEEELCQAASRIEKLFHQ